MASQAAFLGNSVHTGNVLPEWIDYNGHMNVAYYTLVFDLGIDGLWRTFGITEEHIKQTHSSTFAVDSYVKYKQELKLDDPYVVTSQILAFDEKRIHQYQRMYHAKDGYLAATAEWLSLHVDLKSRRVAPWPQHVLDKISEVAQSQPDLPWPEEQGATIKLRNPIYRCNGEST